MNLVRKQIGDWQANLSRRTLENHHTKVQEGIVQKLKSQSVLDTDIRELQNVESYVSYFRELFQFGKLILAPVPKHQKNELLSL
jgi:hypothetical protein